MHMRVDACRKIRLARETRIYTSILLMYIATERRGHRDRDCCERHSACFSNKTLMLGTKKQICKKVNESNATCKVTYA